MKTYAISGAGIAGLACALALASEGHGVTLFDKGRRPGGRVATRRAHGASFNHGAQFVTARGDSLTSALAELQAAGRVAPWPAAGTHKFVGTPGMSALPAALAETAAGRGVRLLSERHVAWLHRADAGWHVRHMPAAEMRPGAVAETGGMLEGPFDAVLLALPAPQAVPLLRGVHAAFAEAAASAVLAPCWAAMAVFATPVPGADILRPETGAIAWAAREPARPGAPAGPDAWTIHAHADWTRAHLESAPEDAASRLLEVFRGLTGADAPLHLSGHRWRHAQVETPLGQPCLWDGSAAIGAAGDWCIGPRVEAAWESGTALARAVHPGA